MRVPAWLLAASVVTVTNLAALVPAYRARTGSVQAIPIAVCSSHLVGGYGEHDRLRLSIRPESDSLLRTLRLERLRDFGYSAHDLERGVDTTYSWRQLPASRPAWVRIAQVGPESRWQVTAIAPTREALADGEGIVVRGRIGLGYDSAPDGSMRLRPMLYSTEPHSLHLPAGASETLRALRQRGERCVANAAALGNATDGSVWVLPRR